MESAFAAEELRDLSLPGSHEAHFLVERLLEGRWDGRGRALLAEHTGATARVASVRVRIRSEQTEYNGERRIGSEVEIEADIDGSRTRPLKFRAFGFFAAGEFFPTELNTLSDLSLKRENGTLRLRAQTRIALPGGEPERIEAELER